VVVEEAKMVDVDGEGVEEEAIGVEMFSVGITEYMGEENTIAEELFQKTFKYLCAKIGQKHVNLINEETKLKIY
jgi:hypothetical protein